MNLRDSSHNRIQNGPFPLVNLNTSLYCSYYKHYRKPPNKRDFMGKVYVSSKVVRSEGLR